VAVRSPKAFIAVSLEVSSALMAEVSPRPVGAASQSPPRASCTIMFRQIAGKPRIPGRCWHSSSLRLGRYRYCRWRSAWPQGAAIDGVPATGPAPTVHPSTASPLAISFFFIKAIQCVAGKSTPKGSCSQKSNTSFSSSTVTSSRAIP